MATKEVKCKNCDGTGVDPKVVSASAEMNYHLDGVYWPEPTVCEECKGHGTVEVFL